MATSHKQDREFREAIISDSLLEDAIEWIQNNMEPEEVFSESQLIDWAKNFGFVEEE